MQLIKSPESTKRESFIQIGKHRHRIANDHHAILRQLTEDFRYMSMQELLFFTSFIGANLLQAFNPVTLITVRNRAERERQ